MWSSGCVLAEFYSGNVLFRGRDNDTVLSQVVELLGILPLPGFSAGKYFSKYQNMVSKRRDESDTFSQQHRINNLGDCLNCRNHDFLSLLTSMLELDPVSLSAD